MHASLIAAHAGLSASSSCREWCLFHSAIFTTNDATWHPMDSVDDGPGLILHIPSRHCSPPFPPGPCLLGASWLRHRPGANGLTMADGLHPTCSKQIGSDASNHQSSNPRRHPTYTQSREPPTPWNKIRKRGRPEGLVQAGSQGPWDRRGLLQGLAVFPQSSGFTMVRGWLLFSCSFGKLECPEIR